MTLKIEFPNSTELPQLVDFDIKEKNTRDAAIKLIETNGFFESIYEIAENRSSDTHISNDNSSQEYVDRILSEAESIRKMAHTREHANTLKDSHGNLPPDWQQWETHYDEVPFGNLVDYYENGGTLSLLPQTWVDEYVNNPDIPLRLKRDHGAYRLIGNFLYRRLKELSPEADCIAELKDIHDQRFDLASVKTVVREIKSHLCFDRSDDAFNADLSISAYNELKRLNQNGITSDATTSSRQPTSKVYQTLGILLALNDFITLGDIKNSPQEWTGVRAGELKALSKNLIDDGTVSLSNIKRVVNLLKLAICHLVGLIPSHMIFKRL
jgi:hypothetical protein